MNASEKINLLAEAAQHIQEAAVALRKVSTADANFYAASLEELVSCDHGESGLDAYIALMVKQLSPAMRQEAIARVTNTPELEDYESIILYDWPEGETHWRWIASAPVSEIISWASAIAQDESEEETE